MSVTIQFQAGPGRDHPGTVNYMMNREHDLYAEVPFPDGAQEDFGYFPLKSAIQTQAEAAGIPADALEFFYDGQEARLSEDARRQ